MKATLQLALLAALFAGGACAAAEPLRSLTVCADPGNMPLSNDKREGFENKIAEVIGKSLGIPVQYYWRPSIERGLMRTTLSEGACDLWMDMATDTEGAITTAPLYRSTFVFAYRNDKGYHFDSFGDKELQKLRIGVFQVSAIRQAMAPWGIMANTVVHYLSHNGDLVAENQPSYQVQQVIDGQLDIAAAWGPMAGYFATKLHQPVTVQPVNLFAGDVPLEFDMALAVPRGRPDVKTAIEDTMRKEKDQIQAILTDYGVPLVTCEECVIAGNLPSHGPYKKQDANTTASAPLPVHTSSIPELKAALAHGAKPDEELANAVVADDAERVNYLLAHGAHIEARFLDGTTALTNSTRFGFTDLVTALIAAKTDPNATDISGWTPLMYAAWIDDPAVVQQLVKAGAKLELADDNGLTALGVAAQNAKAKALEALVAAGADVNRSIGKAGYTPLMLASIASSEDIASFLIAHGADVNAKNAGGVTALMVVAANNTTRIGSLLLKSGADPTVKSEDGRTAKTIAEANNSQAMLQLLQSSGAQGKTSGS
ncbi:MAG TPA: quinoprotein dehydrogenase-associated putative ABC transporter substrate-binding protein [Rudaea sp.]|jgi:quinoprotein dehydrogenase-associated probable ABC transporter substrate-binding protein|nr:quinoprotein dehydrogenase-associated putative ABC transporter substrate-binding protein [Rudaea sp.]